MEAFLVYLAIGESTLGANRLIPNGPGFPPQSQTENQAWLNTRGVGTGVLPHARRLPEVLQRGASEGEAGLDGPDAVP